MVDPFGTTGVKIKSCAIGAGGVLWRVLWRITAYLGGNRVTDSAGFIGHGRSFDDRRRSRPRRRIDAGDRPRGEISDRGFSAGRRERVASRRVAARGTETEKGSVVMGVAVEWSKHCKSIP